MELNKLHYRIKIIYKLRVNSYFTLTWRSHRAWNVKWHESINSIEHCPLIPVYPLRINFPFILLSLWIIIFKSPLVRPFLSNVNPASTYYLASVLLPLKSNPGHPVCPVRRSKHKPANIRSRHTLHYTSIHFRFTCLLCALHFYYFYIMPSRS